MKRRFSCKRGFTAIELCVVTAVAFLLIACLWLVHRGVVLAGRSTEDTATAVSRAQLAMERVRADLLAAAAGEIELGEGNVLRIAGDSDAAASYEQQDGVLVREAAGKRANGPEETRVTFHRMPQRPQAVTVHVVSVSRGRVVTLEAEHACENSARRVQHPEWNPLAASAEELPSDS